MKLRRTRTQNRRERRADADRHVPSDGENAANPEWLDRQLAMRRRERDRARKANAEAAAAKPAGKPAGKTQPRGGAQQATRRRSGSASGAAGASDFHADVAASSRARTTKQRPRRAAKPAPTRAQIRARERRRQLNRRRLRGVVIVVVAAALVASVWVVPRMSVFNVRNIQITGASAVPDLAVRSRIDADLRGQTIFTVDRTRIQDRIAQLPFVRSVRVDRRLPDGLSITISEYRPLALGLAANGSWLVARDGRVLVKARLDDWQGRVPVVRLSHNNVKPGDRVGDEPALRLLRQVPPTFPGSFRTVELTPAGIIGAISDGPQVRIGRPESFEEKLLVTGRLLSMYGPVRRAQIQYIDVTVPGRPAIKVSG